MSYRHAVDRGKKFPDITRRRDRYENIGRCLDFRVPPSADEGDASLSADTQRRPSEGHVSLSGISNAHLFDKLPGLLH